MRACHPWGPRSHERSLAPLNRARHYGGILHRRVLVQSGSLLQAEPQLSRLRQFDVQALKASPNGTAKARPWSSDPANFQLITPRTFPFRSETGPPLLPGFADASV